MRTDDLNAASDARRRVGVVSVGDPRAQGTWRGTPRNLIGAFERLGIEPVPIDARRPRALRLWRFAEYQAKLLASAARQRAHVEGLLSARLGVVFGRSDYQRLRSMRTAHAAHVRRIAASLGIEDLIHMGTWTLPLDDQSGLRHYAYCDTTWHAVAAYADKSRSYSDSLLRLFDELEQQAYSNASHVFVHSRYTANDLEAHYGIEPDRISVVGSGLGHMQPFHGEKDYAAKRVLFAGVRFEEQGGPLIVEAVKRAAEHVPGLELTVVGDERYEHSFTETAGITGLGYVSEQALQELFNRATLMAMPAPVEPWGLVYLEALACKTPILGLRRHAFPELAGDGRFGFIVEEPTVGEITERLVDAFSDPERLRRMGEEGQRHVLEAYSWDRVATTMLGAMPGRELAVG